MTAALMQAIRVETSPGHVESAVMLLVDMESASAEMRLSAIARRYPLHTIMFAQDGSLLIANRAALEAFQLNASGAPPPLQTSLTPHATHALTHLSPIVAACCLLQTIEHAKLSYRLITSKS